MPSAETTRGARRKLPEEVRRRAILDAALAVFAARGFEAARLDDVAAKAGVAKGTLYLYFDDKAALFEALVRHAASPVLGQIESIVESGLVPPLVAIETMLRIFQTEVLGTDRRHLLHLVIAEGPRFPEIARFYHREVVSRGLRIVRTLADRAVRDGTFSSDAAGRHPQLVVAPLLVAVLWDALFSKIEPLDVSGLLSAHLDILTGKPARSPR